MTIRRTLLALTAFLGLALIATVALQIRGEVRDYREAQRLAASNAVREHLLFAAMALAGERTATYGHLLDPARPAGISAGVVAARRRVDEARAAAEAAIRGSSGQLGHADASLRALAQVATEVAGLRAEADAAFATAAVGEGRRLAPRWFAEVTRVIEETQSLRLSLLQQERVQDPATRSEGLLRYYTGLLSESVARNQALLTQALAGRAGLGPAELDAASRNVGRTQLAWELIREQLSAPLAEGVRASVNTAWERYAGTLASLQETLLSSLRGRAWSSIKADQWSDAAEATLVAVHRLQEDILRSSRTRLDAQLTRALGSLAIWSTLLVAGVAALLASAYFVSRRIVLPLEVLRHTMLRLAENDLAAPLPRFARMDEIGEMNDALRVFKANAVRRQRLQEDKEMLHARLTEAYRQLREDLDAAATIQNAMLPAPAVVSGLRHSGLYRPSSVIAGDTYNVLPRGDGRVGFFQVDVAGHGAPAALVSVASHHALSQALLKKADSTGIEEIAAEISRDWPADLPYFTMVLGEIDARSGRAVIVQAGHPPAAAAHPERRGDPARRRRPAGRPGRGRGVRARPLPGRPGRPAHALFRRPRRGPQSRGRDLLRGAPPRPGPGPRGRLHRDAAGAHRRDGARLARLREPGGRPEHSRAGADAWAGRGGGPAPAPRAGDDRCGGMSAEPARQRPARGGSRGRRVSDAERRTGQGAPVSWGSIVKEEGFRC